jgi:hypothetical protein
VLQATGTAYVGVDPYTAREQAGQVLGYPQCVNETYGCMSAQCLIDTYASFGLEAYQAWVTFDQAYAIASTSTGQLNGTGWYHFVGIRGVSGGELAIANSAEGYRGVYSTLDRAQFNALGPFQAIYLANPQPARS